VRTITSDFVVVTLARPPDHRSSIVRDKLLERPLESRLARDSTSEFTAANRAPGGRSANVMVSVEPKP